MRNLLIIILIAIAIGGGVLYSIRPHNGDINVTPISGQVIGSTGTSGHSGVVVIVTSHSSIQFENISTPTKTGVVDMYLKTYLGMSLAFSANNGQTTYYLPADQYTKISKAIALVLGQESNAQMYYSILGNPLTGVHKLQYCPSQYAANPVVFANKCGNDLNFFEAYAYGNGATPFTMIILMNNNTTHVAYVEGNSVYDIFNTYNYTDYVNRIIYKYNPTVAYIITFDEQTIGMQRIPLITGAHRMDLEATGMLSSTPITIVLRKDYYLVNYGSYSVTRDAAAFIYAGAMLSYYPVNDTKIEPIEPIIVNTTDTNYMYLQGTTYTLIPTKNIMDNGNVTIIAYQVINGGEAGNITVTYYN